jgi:hypothetical protein
MPKRKKQKKTAHKEREESSVYRLSDKTAKILWAGGSLLLSLILSFSFFDKAGSIGNILKSIFNFLIGGSAKVLPFFLILVGLVFFKAKTSL